MEFIQNLSWIEIVYWASALIGGLLFLFRAALFFIVGDVDDLDFDTDGVIDASHGDTDISFKLLSLQSLTAFFMMFGLSGLAFINTEMAIPFTILGGTAVGLFSVWVISFIFTFFKGLQSEGTLKIENAIGQIGSVYLRIPKSGIGQVRVTVQGGLKIFDARSASGQEIPSQSPVKVVQVQGSSTLIVERLET